MNWYIGQDIVCIDDSGIESKPILNDTVYKIRGLKNSECKCGIVIDVGIVFLKPSEMKYVGHDIMCASCKTKRPATKEWFFREVRFAPLDSLVNISELTEVLNEPAFK